MSWFRRKQPGPLDLALGFQWARQYRDPAFREHLRSIGHIGDGVPVVPCVPGESIGPALARVEPDSRALVAVADATKPFGWRMYWLTKAETSTRSDAP